MDLPLFQLLNDVKKLEALAKERIAQAQSRGEEKPTAVDQLGKYGVCTCHCHFADNFTHSANPCCGNARMSE